MGYTAIVAGGTGLVGSELIQLLLQDRAYERVIALVRTNIQTQHLQGSEKLFQIVTDFNHLDADILASDIEHAHVFCTLGTTIKKAGSQEQFRKVDLTYPLKLAELASVHHAEVFAIVTAMGANSKSTIFYNRVKGEVEEKLRELNLPALYMLRPSLILGDRKEVRAGEMIGSLVSRAIAPLMIGGLRTYRPIQAKVIAAGLIASAKSGRAGAHIMLSSQIAELADVK
ncbi:nucleoside-diphosphate sugar epimerase [Paenibacillus marchantiophytorum]|uniref:Nucleoside-diphosphate sugar epimerase n=1 Tax=Paenibacillus marchantiophytorum TaxID=1619310 RepID=A0ABQ1EM45_9BACL|nr:NAD(P)H-binding protein [Paenibacillus marchantiophytorum]GFZ78235.1 nucleoside-diphosphate sugar epimerase [Paenibacillus marchantiophytorum]